MTNMHRTLLKSKMLQLRSPEPEDLELLYRMENDTELWSVGNTLLPYSRHTLRQYLTETKHDLYTERQARFIIELADGTPAGMIDLADFDPHNRRAEICIGILSEYRSKGVGRCALKLLIEYALNFLQLHQLYAYITCDNEASTGLFTDAGFKKAGTLRSWHRQGGEYIDVDIYQLVRE